jgi:hypothetical protein
MANIQEDPVLTGYVTRAGSGSDFDVNGVHIVCSGVKSCVIESICSVKQSAVGCPGYPPFLGERLRVYGFRHTELETVDRVEPIIATRIEYQPTLARELSGSAVIDATPSPEPAAAVASGFLVRADGYRIHISGKTKIQWNPPLRSLADVKAGDWIKYKGKQDAAGALNAVSVVIGPNATETREKALRTKEEYDPSAVPADAKQNFLKDAVRVGYDPKRFPPFKDNAMQARLGRIGDSLIPAYQRALPDSDPAKIHFRFQLIDTKLFRGGLALSNGIILVPHQVVERMQNDSQLAAVLAYSIACVLERQEYRLRPAKRVAAAVTIAGIVSGGWVGDAVPSLTGDAMMMGGAEGYRKIQSESEEQSGRVSLELLCDAGYDIDQAPMAWWLLAPGKPKPLLEIEMPDQAGYLYSILGEIWNNPAANAGANDKP